MTSTDRPGASLRVWRDFFPNANIYGADVDKKILFSDNRIYTFYVDQFNPQSIQEMWKNVDQDNFDLIIDDGAHYLKLIKNLFENLFA